MLNSTFYVLLFSILLFFNFSTENKIIKKDKLEVISITFIGDLMCHAPQFEAAVVPEVKDSFNFDVCYTYVQDYFNKSDYTIGNLETVIAGSKERYTGYPAFNTPFEYVTALKNAGIDFLITSNNHSLDRGKRGVLSTIDSIKSLNFGYTGTFNSKRDRDSIRIIDIKGVKLAILAYSYGTNGNNIPKGHEYLINLIDTNLIKKDIEKAKTKNPDIILTYFHFGDEYKQEPNAFQKLIVKKVINYGADIIIGSHPHVLEPIAYFKGTNNLDSGFVAYSLGNFISNQRNRYTDSGVILKFTLAKSSNNVFLGGVEYMPTWVFKGLYNEKLSYIVLPNYNNNAYEEYPFLTIGDKQKMEESFYDSYKILNKYSSKHSVIKKN